LWCTYLSDPDAVPPRVAFAIGRSAGSAVTRNRTRRRLRAILAGMAGRPPLVDGWVLIGASARATELSFDDLRGEMHRLLGRVQ
jgi:ribonuclease P protein component